MDDYNRDKIFADVRGADIRAAVERRRADETKILQNVNAANRDAFLQKFPGQLEHCMRLISERLHHCLNKPQGIDLSKTETWPADSSVLADLAHAISGPLAASRPAVRDEATGRTRDAHAAGGPDRPGRRRKRRARPGDTPHGPAGAHRAMSRREKPHAMPSASCGKITPLPIRCH